MHDQFNWYWWVAFVLTKSSLGLNNGNISLVVYEGKLKNPISSPHTRNSITGTGGTRHDAEKMLIRRHL